VPGGEHETVTTANAILDEIEHDVAATGGNPGAVALSIAAALAPRDGDDDNAPGDSRRRPYRAKADGRRRAHLAGT
jgi:hypothetical protein